jgi:glucose-1-phosphate cytidylyltransferase
LTVIKCAGGGSRRHRNGAAENKIGVERRTGVRTDGDGVMKVVILAGGYGTRLSEETGVIPKPLVEIGGRPILWHIMRIYSHHGFNEFVICCGYKGDVIKDYFLRRLRHQGDLTVDLGKNRVEFHRNVTEPWKVTLADTGEKTMTGGRLKRIRDYIGDSPFCLTYGDGVGDIDIGALVKFHRAQGALGTVTAVQQPGRFGAINLSDDRPRASGFREKGAADGPIINGGFFVMEPEVLDMIEGDSTVWEEGPLRMLTERDQLAVYRHHGFWQNMDTLNDKMILQAMWDKGNPPWQIWAGSDEKPRAEIAARSKRPSVVGQFATSGGR